MDSPVTRRGLMKLLGISAVGGVLLPASESGALDWCSPDRGPTAFRLCSELLFPNQNDSLNAIVDKLQFGNVRYVNGDTISHSLVSDNDQELATGQAPAVMFLSCADSRVVPELLCDQPRAKLFVGRVAGNVVTDEIVASLEYAVKVVGAKYLVVLGHSDCGAVRSAISLAQGQNSFPPEEFGQIRKLLDKIVPAVRIAEGQPGVPSLLERATNANAILTAQTLAQLEPILAPAVRRGDVGVVAAHFDIASGVGTGLWSSFPIS
jgi:carbonic anhydrase